MTVEELRAKKRELKAQKKALLAEGRSQELAMYLVNEELRDVNAQLRDLMPQHCISGPQISATWASDQQQFRDWAQADNSFDDEIDEGHRAMAEVANEILSALTPRQREVFQLRQSGLKEREIAKRLGIHNSVVSRILARAEKNVRTYAERGRQAQKLYDNEVDCSDPTTAKAILSVLTAKQAVYMFLYYAEGLIMPEISVLMGVHETTVIRVIRSGLNRIGFLYIGTQVTLTHIEAMDRLVYEKYCESWNDANYPRVPSYAKKCSAAVRRTKCNKIMGGQLLSALLEEKTRGGAGSG